VIDVPGFEGVYAVTRDGDVWSFHHKGLPRQLSARALQAGYLKVTLCRDGVETERLIHHLVLEAFLAPKPHGHEARHLNGKPDDNRLCNLAWGTPAENAADKRKHGTHPEGEKHGRAKLTRAEVLAIRSRSAEGESNTSIAKDYLVGRKMVSLIVRRKRWTHV